MYQQEYPPPEEATATVDAPTDAPTINSDAAVGGSVGGGCGERSRVAGERPSDAVAATADGADGASGGDGDGVNDSGGQCHRCPVHRHSQQANSHARQRHYRKRALSAAGTSSGTVKNTAGGKNRSNPGPGAGARDDSAGHLSSASLGSNIMGTGAQHSIVTFGLNFNFDNTSSPSNSDSGEGAVGNDGKQDAGGSSEDDVNGNIDNNDGLPSVLRNKATTGPVNNPGEDKKSYHKSKAKAPSSPDSDINNRRGNGGPGKGSDRCTDSCKGSCTKSKSSKVEKQTSAKFGPNAAAALGEGGSGSSTSSGSESYTNNDSGGSASGGSNSGNDGSSGEKSTVSSLTTSSNQEWMATNESAEAVVQAAPESANAAVAAETVNSVVEAKASGPEGKAIGEENDADGTAISTKKKTMANGKKRKKVTILADPLTVDAKECNITTHGGGAGNGRGSEEDDGYKTDEELWGGRKGDRPSSPTPACAPQAASGSIRSPSKSNSSEGTPPPPMKQARFSLGQGHPRAVQSVDASAVSQPLSSLSGSDSAGMPAVTALSGCQTPVLSGTSATAVVTSKPLSTSGPNSVERVAGVGKRKPGQLVATMDPEKRKERNAREKERSCRITRQIDDLRTLLSRGGVIVSKGTKSSVLAEAANYINLLQQQQVQWEMDRQTLMQQIQQIRLAPTPNNIVQTQQQNEMIASGLNGNLQAQHLQQIGGVNTNTISPNDYKFIFDNSSLGMAIASLGGAFVDCNPIFCQLSEYTREEVCSMTIFNMTSRQDLQHAFDLISQMITPTLDNNGNCPEKQDDRSSIVLRGAMKKHSNLGLSVSLIKGNRGIAKCFCITLVRILSMETTRPDMVSIEMELPQVWSMKQQKNVGFGASPAYTSG